MTWSGGTIVAGIESTFVQVVATLQVRDITDATTESPGPVVASDTFLFERTDADFDITLPDAGIVFPSFAVADISSSSGADVTALLRRGRTYRIELEAKCNVQVPVVGVGVCLFAKNPSEVLGFGTVGNPAIGYDGWDNDGFTVSDITVAVGSDSLQDLFGTP